MQGLSPVAAGVVAPMPQRVAAMSPEILHEAVEWLARLDGQPSGRERKAFRVWLAQDEEHIEAFKRMQETQTYLHEHAPAARTALAMKMLALVAVLALLTAVWV